MTLVEYFFTNDAIYIIGFVINFNNLGEEC